jgi:hypothetical protein
MTYRILTTILLVVVIGGAAGITWQYTYGAEKTMTDYVGTGDWLTEVDKCVDLYHETEQNETLYYGCMNKLEKGIEG